MAAKSNTIRVRLSDKRANKLRLYARNADKTMTQVIESCIDLLPNTAVENSSLSNAVLIPENLHL